MTVEQATETIEDDQVSEGTSAEEPSTATAVLDASDETNADGTAATSEKPSDEDFWKRAGEQDLDEMLKRLPKLQGKVGSAAQKQAVQQATALAEKMVEQRLAALEEDRKRAVLDELVERDDLYQLGQVKRDEFLTEKQKRAQSANTDELERGVWSTKVDPILLGMMDDLSEEEQASIKDKYTTGGYGSDPVAARKTYFKEVREAYAKAQVDSAIKRYEKDILPAKVKERLGEEAELEPTHDSGTGTPPRGPMTQVEFDKIRDDEATLYLPDVWKRFEAGRKAGLIMR